MEKVAFIIGGSSGIGLATGKLLKEKGYTVYNGSRHCSPQQDVVSLTVDVTQRRSIEQAVEIIAEREGGIDVLVYSAGYSMAAPVEHAGEDDYRYLFDVNYFGAVAAVQTVLPAMKQRGGGRMVFLSSVGGVLPIAYDAFYSSSKAALDMLVKELNLELNPLHIRATSVLPGGTRTPFTSERNVYPAESAGSYAEDMYSAAESLARMEQGGMDPAEVARTVVRVIESPLPPLVVAAGLTNKLYRLASRIMPDRPVQQLLKKTYRLDSRDYPQ